MSGTQSKQSSVPRLTVAFETAEAGARELSFQSRFQIGRVDTCEVCIPNEFVSRAHAEVVFGDGNWYVRDLGSANGIFLNGQRVESVAVHGPTTIRLGIEGPSVTFTPQAVLPPPAPPAAGKTVDEYINRYFAESTEPAGEHTMLVRKAFSEVRNKQKRRYTWIVAVLAVLLLTSAAVAVYQSRQAGKQRALAQDLFYTMKALDVDIANLEKIVIESNNAQGQAQEQRYRARRIEMEKNYDRFLNTMRVYDPKISEQDRLILRVARIFGECELAMPGDFIQEVNEYIKKWQSSGRLARAVRTANQNGYTKVITQELLKQNLPPQFFYLALQESDFDPYISGPPTYKGIAKGMWQFIPETGAKYGLKIGPLVELRRPDTADDRHHWDLATRAASQYLKDIYTMEAQASGFLVMACYNWGEHRVLPLVRSMPPNPRDRNFWKLLASYKEKVPKETYDYVFYIVSAAVIGENPRLFGFDFDNPLAHLETR